MVIFIIHLLLVSFFSYKIAQRFVPEVLERILAAYLIVWTNLVVTALFLSYFSLLGDRQLYFRFSVLATLIVFGIVYRKNPYPSLDLRNNVVKFFRRSFSLWETFLLVTFLFFLCANIVIVFSFSPNNYDSLTYHLPRIHFYLSQGHLGHFTTINTRMTFFPFNFQLLQLICVTYGQPDWLINFPNLLSWILAGLALFVLCRRVGLSVSTAFLSSWIGLTSTQVLAQATTTTVDLPVAVPLLIGVIFSIRWLNERKLKNIVFAGLAFGLSAGSKITIFFYWPVGFALAGFIIFRIFQKKISLQQAFRGIKHWLVAGLIAVSLSTPFLMINYYYSKQLMTSEYDFLLNKPFNWKCAVQTIYTYSLQLAVEPLQRTAIDIPGINISGAARSYLEPRVRKYFLPTWNPNYAVSDLFVFPPDLNEDHVWFGFAGPCIMLSVLLVIVLRSPRKTVIFWLGLASIMWLFTYCSQNKWSLYTQRYFIGAFLLGIPCAGYFIENLTNRISVLRHFVNICIVFLVTTSALFGYIYVMTNTTRALPLIFDPTQSRGFPQRPHQMLETLSQYNKINIVYAGKEHGNERLYCLMNTRRSQEFLIGTMTRPDWYNVYSHWSPSKEALYVNIPSTSSYITLTIPDKKTPGLNYLGSIGTGLTGYDYYGYDATTNAADSLKLSNLIMMTAVFDGFADNRLSDLQLHLNGIREADSLYVKIYSDDGMGNRTDLATFSKDAMQHVATPKKYKYLLVVVYEKSTNNIVSQGQFLVKNYEGEKGIVSNTTQTVDLIAERKSVKVSLDGFKNPEGPYPQWNLPLVRWANKSIAQFTFNNDIISSARPVVLSLSFRPQIRPAATMVVQFNDKIMKTYQLTNATAWNNDELKLYPIKGMNTIEFSFPMMKGEKPLPDSLYMLFKTLSFSGL